MKRYLSIWLPHLPAERLLRRPPPELGSLLAAGDGNKRLFAVLCQDHQGTKLDGLCPNAMAAGLQSGMAVSDARAAWPGLVTWPGDRAEDAHLLQMIARYMERYSPWPAIDVTPFEQVRDNQGSNPVRHSLMLDVSGVAHLFGGEEGLLMDVARSLQRMQLTRRLGLADTAGAAWAAARYAPANQQNRQQNQNRHYDRPFALFPHGVRATKQALAPLPVAALRLDPADVENLMRFGLRRIGDLYDMPRRSLTVRLGGRLLFRLDQALGDQGESLDPLAPLPENRVSMAFMEPIALPDDLHQACRELCDNLCRLLATRNMGIRRACLRLERVDGVKIDRQAGTSFPGRDPDHLYQLFSHCFDTVDPGFGIESMSLSLVMGEQLAASQNDLALTGHETGHENSGKTGPDSALAPLVDRIGQRLPDSRDGLYRLWPGPNHNPDQAPRALPVFALDPVLPADMPTPPAMPRRPIRLLVPPEPVEYTDKDAGLNPIRPGDILQPPKHFLWRRQHHALHHCKGPERLRRNWWPGHNPDDRLFRDFFRIETRNGLHLWLSRVADPQITDNMLRWYVEGLFG